MIDISSVVSRVQSVAEQRLAPQQLAEYNRFRDQVLAHNTHNIETLEHDLMGYIKVYGNVL